MPPIHRRTVILTIAAGAVASCAMRPHANAGRAAVSLSGTDPEMFEPTFDSTIATFDSTLADFGISPGPNRPVGDGM
jgi:hypothetical protein